MIPSFARPQPGGLVLAVRLTPKAARDSIDGPGESADGKTHLKARVRAVPEKGKANKALEVLLAAWLGIPASSVLVVAGGTARLKSVQLTGDPDTLAEAITDLLQGS
ncbi:MAG: DUF167 domain-containing protein [Notoacmeibacter sp.]|nr:DUF167 domain-containing protein [Notoacmeibacter sp.]